MYRSTLHTCYGILLLGLMVLVPTDLLRIGLNTLVGGHEIGMMMSLEMESDMDCEDKEKSKEKEKEKNKITFELSMFLNQGSGSNYHGSANELEAMSHPLAHYLEVSTPPPDLG